MSENMLSFLFYENTVFRMTHFYFKLGGNIVSSLQNKTKVMFITFKHTTITCKSREAEFASGLLDFFHQYI